MPPRPCLPPETAGTAATAGSASAGRTGLGGGLAVMGQDRRRHPLGHAGIERRRRGRPEAELGVAGIDHGHLGAGGHRHGGNGRFGARRRRQGGAGDRGGAGRGGVRARAATGAAAGGGAADATCWAGTAALGLLAAAAATRERMRWAPKRWAGQPRQPSRRSAGHRRSAAHCWRPAPAWWRRHRWRPAAARRHRCRRAGHRRCTGPGCRRRQPAGWWRPGRWHPAGRDAPGSRPGRAWWCWRPGSACCGLSGGNWVSGAGALSSPPIRPVGSRSEIV